MALPWCRVFFFSFFFLLPCLERRGRIQLEVRLCARLVLAPTSAAAAERRASRGARPPVHAPLNAEEMVDFYTRRERMRGKWRSEQRKNSGSLTLNINSELLFFFFFKKNLFKTSLSDRQSCRRTFQNLHVSMEERRSISLMAWADVASEIFLCMARKDRRFYYAF